MLPGYCVIISPPISYFRPSLTHAMNGSTDVDLSFSADCAYRDGTHSLSCPGCASASSRIARATQPRSSPSSPRWKFVRPISSSALATS